MLPSNQLPRDGTVLYYGRILTNDLALLYFERLLSTVEWRHDELVMFGKRIVTARKMAWYGDGPFVYAYSGTSRTALPWTDDLRELKQLVEQRSAATYNSCLLNLYHQGAEGMAWHSDDEVTMAAGCAIASLSLGAERKFSFKHKHTGERVSLVLENGSLLVMRDETQTWWLHSLPKSKRVTTARINLTFRTFVSAR